MRVCYYQKVNWWKSFRSKCNEEVNVFSCKDELMNCIFPWKWATTNFLTLSVDRIFAFYPSSHRVLSCYSASVQYLAHEVSSPLREAALPPWSSQKRLKLSIRHSSHLSASGLQLRPQDFATFNQNAIGLRISQVISHLFLKHQFNPNLL